MRAVRLAGGLSALAIVALGGVRLLRDGAFWWDEAPIALSIRDLGVFGLFGPLVEGLSFPRIYLASIALAEWVGGYHTLVLRLVPFVFFALATGLWIRLLVQRFGSSPGLVAVGILLFAVPGTWIGYGTMLKQYSYDVFAVLLVLSLSDDLLASGLRRERGAWRLAASAALCATSYTVAFAWLARVAAWAAGERWRGDRAKRGIDPGAALRVGAIFALACISLWITDVRHLADTTVAQWETCIPGSPLSNPERFGSLFRGVVSDWYRGGRVELSLPDAAVPSAWVVGLELATLLGALRMGRGAPRGWSSRSLACALCLVAFALAAPILRYPMCAGRLTLFLLFPLQLLALEGLDWILGAVRARRGGAALSGIVCLALAAGIAPAAWRNLAHLARSPTPGDFRPLLDRVRARPDLPVLVSPCSALQVEALPEGLGGSQVIHWEALVSQREPFPDGREVWVLDADRPSHCGWYLDLFERRASRVERVGPGDSASTLLRVELRDRGDRR